MVGWVRRAEFRSRWLGLLAGLALLSGAGGSKAEEVWPDSGTEVDVALVLAVDISYSMDLEELQLQRDGYIAALTSKPVLDAIRGGMIGRIGITYLEWAGVSARHLVADWHVIEDRASADAFVARIREAPIRRARRTSITTAIEFSMDRLKAAQLRPIRRVIDISGDGPNNEGGIVTVARDRALDAGVTINGLPIILKRGYSSPYDVRNLDTYYQNCVIGGPGAFLVTITERAQFEEAIRTKILREVAQATLSDVSPVQVQSGADCLIGEQQWRRNWEQN